MFWAYDRLPHEQSEEQFHKRKPPQIPYFQKTTHYQNNKYLFKSVSTIDYSVQFSKAYEYASHIMLLQSISYFSLTTLYRIRVDPFNALSLSYAPHAYSTSSHPLLPTRALSLSYAPPLYAPRVHKQSKPENHIYFFTFNF